MGKLKSRLGLDVIISSENMNKEVFSYTQSSDNLSRPKSECSSQFKETSSDEVIYYLPKHLRSF
jgi:hypothetical protein